MKTPLSQWKGIGPKRISQLQKIGVFAAEDFLVLVPRRYEDHARIVPIDQLSGHMGEAVSVVATILSPPVEKRIYGGRLITEVLVGDDSGRMTVTFFNNPYIRYKLQTEQRYHFYGRMDPKMLLHMTAPQITPLREGEAPPGIFPVYPLSDGLTQNLLRQWTKEALQRCKTAMEDPLPEALLKKYRLISLEQALNKLHFPKTEEDIVQSRRRLIFEELLYFQLGLKLFSGRDREKNSFPAEKRDVRFQALQPFTPTKAQEQAVAEILADMGKDFVMNRLLQGDVGSGKTYVAGEAAAAALQAGYQAAIMAPTELLARQHAAYFSTLFEKMGYRTGLLVGSLRAGEKEEIYRALEEGTIQLVIGTHALLQKKVQFRSLGLVIADEQHRFGVRQRASLAEKGHKPHVLVMSATPIPRTMALMVWGDLALSVLEEKPAGRQEVKTFLVDSGYQERIDAFIERQLAAGGQIYLVCPLVEESENADLKSAETLFARLQARYGDRVELVHGKMNAAKKEKAMARFSAGSAGILVSTTVIEVGINVPSATVMMLLNAERFGLSQLHQLRGRVGRGTRQSYCILISDSKNEKTLERLHDFCRTIDGFAIAQKDLELRGPGDFFGDQQHGLPKMHFADMARNLELLTLSNACAQRMLQYDPYLQTTLNSPVRKRVEQLFKQKETIFN